MPDIGKHAPSSATSSRHDQAMSTEEFYRELIAQAEGRPYAPPPPEPEPESVRPMSTLDYYRELLNPEPAAKAPLPSWEGADWRIPGGLTVAEYCDMLAAAGAERERDAAPAPGIGPRSGLAMPARPENCRRVAGGYRLFSWTLWVRGDGRVLAKQERAGGKITDYAYEYDQAGHLLRVWRNGRLAEEYAYDAHGARIADWSPRHGPRELEYDARGRLVRAGELRYDYATDGTLRRVSGPGGEARCWYGPTWPWSGPCCPTAARCATTARRTAGSWASTWTAS